jgi:hypothetical protein
MALLARAKQWRCWPQPNKDPAGHWPRRKARQGEDENNADVWHPHAHTFFEIVTPNWWQQRIVWQAISWSTVEDLCLSCSVSWMCQSYWLSVVPSDQERSPKWTDHPAEEWGLCIAVAP